jgi:hypothetical protein
MLCLNRWHDSLHQPLPPELGVATLCAGRHAIAKLPPLDLPHSALLLRLMFLLVGYRWATIALTTFTARLCLFPITLYQMRSTAKMTVRKTAPNSCQSVH